MAIIICSVLHRPSQQYFPSKRKQPIYNNSFWLPPPLEFVDSEKLSSKLQIFCSFAHFDFHTTWSNTYYSPLCGLAYLRYRFVIWIWKNCVQCSEVSQVNGEPLRSLNTLNTLERENSDSYSLFSSSCWTQHSRLALGAIGPLALWCSLDLNLFLNELGKVKTFWYHTSRPVSSAVESWAGLTYSSAGKNY